MQRYSLQELTSAVETERGSDSLSEQASDYEDEEYNSSKYYTDEEYTNLPEVTLTSFTETGEGESTIPVLKQRSYTGRMIISSALADALCADLGVDRMLEELNTVLGTSYSLDSSVISILNSYISQSVDFGTAYAYLRRYWKDIRTIESKLRTREAEDREMRQSVLADGRITKPDVPPRRVWDLYANRVVPYWVACNKLRAISHAWVEERDRMDVMTPINGCEWPVPMPKDVNLDLIRIEMLNTRPNWVPRFKAEYAWLDVLCLRQEGGKSEHLRLDEWKLDVPTIGWVYWYAWQVVCYFSGLGRPLCLAPGYFESDRCWFRRAWTLQEMTLWSIIAGVTGKDATNTQVERSFYKQLASLRSMRLGSTSILDLLSEMRNRVSTKLLDQVAGLVYLLEPDVIPIYDAEQSPADAWEALMDVMKPESQVQLLFSYPEPGNGMKRWRPSWSQVMSSRILGPRFHWEQHPIYRTEDPDIDYYMGYCIESGQVRGLCQVPNKPMLRQGKLVFDDANGESHTLKVIANHSYPIPDGFYKLLGCKGIHSNPDRWVVGHVRQDGRFEKLSVFRSAGDEEADLYSLALEGHLKTFLC
ncbi:hypothetical protein EDD18DRAFT_1460286 [Armillaria luteobubalina]|uniref:Heterokaryon incompatibility domain-containing protein n=1 Tax=Armillaria luteobubalina TaxID=153913 RepID=A0AA39UQR8_9AGAR|nr:hypothetical protein EDD18DRAFT_1460286 [Armillaria luteobubalina]